jgi:Tol biopolymer transport system component
VQRAAFEEGRRRRDRRRRRTQQVSSALCVLLVGAVAVLVANRAGGPSSQVQVGQGLVEPHVMANGKIAFIRSAGPGDPAPKIYVMNEDGSGQQMIAETTQGSNLAWSPDGTMLAFWDVGGIYTIHADGSDETRVPTTSRDDHSPAWSPDGTQLAVSGAGGIAIVNVDGSGRRQLTNDDAGFGPAWSPDGRRIAYAGLDDLYVVNEDGTHRARLTSVGPNNDAPTWSPDGTQIAFRHNSTISVVAVDGGAARTLASPGGTGVANPNGRGANKLAAGGGDPSTPRWSPDGTKIVYALYQSGTSCSIWVVASDGSGQTPLTDGSSCDRDPSWQPLPR